MKRWRRESVRLGKRELGFWCCEARGARPGPTLAIVAGQHGMEPTGPAMLAKFLDGLDVRDLRGTLRAVPLANIAALRCGFECDVPPALLARAQKHGMSWGGCPFHRNRQTCGRNMNRMWPGKARGSIYERLVAAMWERVVAGADYGIDFHCWSDAGPAGVISYSDEGIALGRRFGLPHLHRYPLTDHPGLFALHAMRAGITSITVELTPQRRITASGAETGRRGLVNLMRHLKMLPGRETPLPEQFLLEFKRGDQRPIKLPWDALVLLNEAPGRWHRKGDLLGTAVRLDRPQTVRPLTAPCDGLLAAEPSSAMVAQGQSALTFYRCKRLPAVRKRTSAL